MHSVWTCLNFCLLAVLNSLFPVRPIPFCPFPFCPNFSRFAHSLLALSNFTLFPFCPVSVLPFCCFAQFHFRHFSFRLEAILPNFPISPNDHFALFPLDPFPFHPNAIFLISGPKTNWEILLIFD